MEPLRWIFGRLSLVDELLPVGCLVVHLRIDGLAKVPASAHLNSPHFVAGVAFVAVEVHLVVGERHLHPLHLVLEVLEMGRLLHERLVVEGFVDEPHEHVDGVFIGAGEVFDGKDDLEGCGERMELVKRVWRI
jgi:hypothetical protein